VTIIRALSRSIYSQEVLENVILHAPIDDITLRYLSTLPTLKVLSVNLSKRSRPRTGSFLPADPPFCSAERLEFSTSDLDLVTSLLRPRDQIFHTLRLFYHCRLTPEAVVHLLKVLASRSYIKSFQEFILITENFFHPTPANQMGNEATRYTLIRDAPTVFRSLRVLVIEWSEQISLDDTRL